MNGVVGYIATQGPLDSTIADFWLMVWLSNACVILMLAKLMEANKVGFSHQLKHNI
jgi:protein tyrosine phosphatase